MMKPVPGRVEHNPPDSYGDCLTACIASVLERDDVPHFMHDGDPEHEYRQRVSDWAVANGLSYFRFGFENVELRDLLLYMAQVNPDCYYVLGGSSPAGGHAVVCLNDQIVYDPAGRPAGQQLVGPDEDGVYAIDVFGAGVLNR